jgi:4-hydroxybenzoate polyprenyltransferase
MASPKSHAVTYPGVHANIAHKATFAALFEAARPKQWAKNLVIFAGTMFSKNIFSIPYFVQSCQAFALFCLLSSSVYLINDVVDAEKDKQHPKKRLRPVASGQLTASTALVAAALLAALALVGSITLGRTFFVLALGYFVLMNVYSLHLKRVVTLDVMVIAVGFVIRAVAGASAVGVEISQWLVICTTFLALFLGLCKRRHEIVSLGSDAKMHRESLIEYNGKLLDQFIAVASTCAVMSYALYTLSPRTVGEFGDSHLVYTVPLVVFAIFRYLYLVHRKNGGGSPEVLLFSDMPLLSTIISWALLSGLIIYL